MMTTNYQKGRAKEYQIKKQLESEGWTVLRSAGSHGFADLVAIHQELRVIKFVQCKPNNFSELERKSLEDNALWLNNMFRCEFEVI